MNFIHRDFDWYKEKYGGLCLGGLLLLLTFIIQFKLTHLIVLIKEFPSIGMCTFGFLLTLLGIIIQSNTETINHLKKRTTLYNRFINFNKKTVKISFILSVFSYILGYSELLQTCIESNRYIELSFVGCWIGLFAWFLWDSIYFIKSFYLLINAD